MATDLIPVTAEERTTIAKEEEFVEKPEKKMREDKFFSALVPGPPQAQS